MDNNKRIVLQIRLDKELKDTFTKLCDDKAINSSKLIRQLITQWITEQTTPNNPHNRGTDI